MAFALMRVAVMVTLFGFVSCDVVTNKMVAVDDFQKGFKLKYINSYTKYTSSRIGCATACASDESCNSVNIRKTDGKFVCEMSSEGIGFMDTHRLVADADYRYYEKKTPCLNGGIWNAASSQCDNCHFLTRGQYCDVYVTDCHHALTQFTGLSNLRNKPTMIQPTLSSIPFVVCCDFKYDHIRWARRMPDNGFVNFTRGWQDYKNGFGNLETCQDNFFLGLEKVHLITTQHSYKFQFWIALPSPVAGTGLRYSPFSVGDEASSYTLHTTPDNVPTAFTDEFSPLNGAQFFTYDHDCPANCAKECMSGWWFQPGFTTCPDGNLHSPQDNLKWRYNGVQKEILWYDLKLMY